MAAALLEPTPKGALALHLLAPWGKGGATWWFETDAGVLLEAKPVAPVETTRTPRVRVVATSGGGGFGKQRLLFAKLRRIVRCFSSLGRLNDCECTNTIAQKGWTTEHQIFSSACDAGGFCASA
jgi:hypothetical protein